MPTSPPTCASARISTKAFFYNMYHYQKNIGDYRSATMHFSLLEHGIYNQLLDWYYLDESPLPSDNRTLSRRLSIRTEAEEKAMIDVLSEMFQLTDLGWTHKRVDREITQYKAKAKQAREAGKLGGRPSKKGIGSIENRDGSEKKPDAKPTANQEPLTNNHKPVVVKAPRTKSRTQIDPCFLPNEAGEAAAASKGVNLITEIQKFTDYHTAKGSLMADWQAAWRTWIGNAKGMVIPRESFAERDERLARDRVREFMGDDSPPLFDIVEDQKRIE